MKEAELILLIKIIKNALNKARRINHDLWTNTLDREKMNKHKSISDLLKGAEEIAEMVENDDCQNCPVADKLDRLTEAIEQGYMIAEKSKTPFKMSCISRISAEDAEKMARGGTD